MHDIISCSQNKNVDPICSFSCNLLQNFGFQIYLFFFKDLLIRNSEKLSIHVDVFIVYCFKQNHYYIYIYIHVGI